MRIPSGTTDRYIYFVAVDATDLKTRETGLSSFTVYRSRNGGVAAAMTTPTINETDTTNMPGVYELLLDEDTTLAAGNDTEEMVFHITEAAMAPVTRVIELYRPETTEGNTLDVTSTGEAGLDYSNTNGTIGNADVDWVDASNRVDVGSWLGTAVTTSATTNKPEVDVNSVSDDATAANNLELDYDGTGYNKSASTIGTCTTNTDMRGTDSAALASDYTSARAGYLDNLNIGENVAGTSEVGHLVSASGTSDSGTTTTMVDAARTEASTDHWKGSAIIFGSGGSANNVGAVRLITGFTPASDTITFEPAVITAITTETYTIVPWAYVELLTATQASIDAIETDTNSLNDTKIPNTLNTTASGNIGIDWANVENPTTAVDLSATDIQLADTVTTLTGHTAQTGDNFARLGAPAGASVSADIAAVQADTDNIQTRIPAALIGGRMDSDVEAINNDTTAADNLAKSAIGIVTGAAAGTPTTTVIDTDLTEATNDHYKGRILTFTSGAIAGQSTDITAYNGTTKELTVTALTDAPSASDTFVIT